MEVVLKQDVDQLGLRGEVVNVARGYARNYLLPRGLAEVATPGLLREIEKRDAIRARHEAKNSGEAEAIAQRLQATELRFEVNAGPSGALFGSVTATHIADRLWEEQKIRLDRRKIGIETIKRIGRYTIPVEVFTDVTAELRLIVVPEGGELPPEEPEIVEAPEETARPEPVLETAPAIEAESAAEEPVLAAGPAAEPEGAQPVAEAEVAADGDDAA